MAKAKRTVLFTAPDAVQASAAAAAFNTAAGRLGLPWVATPTGDPANVEVLVPLDGKPPDGFAGRVESWPDCGARHCAAVQGCPRQGRSLAAHVGNACRIGPGARR